MKTTVFADFESAAKTFDIFIRADDGGYSDHFATMCMCVLCVGVCMLAQ